MVHVTNIAGSPNSTIGATYTNNSIGYTSIGASNPAGASGDIVFANVEFTAVGSSGDSTPVNLDVITLYDRSSNVISTIVSNGSFTIPSSDPAPYLVNYTISNTTISPNGDGIKDDTKIHVEFSETMNTTIRTLYTGSDVTDPDPQSWNGTDDGGNIVADGTYQVNVTMDDGVNPIVHDNTRSIRVANMSVAIISIGNASGTNRAEKSDRCNHRDRRCCDRCDYCHCDSTHLNLPIRYTTPSMQITSSISYTGTSTERGLVSAASSPSSWEDTADASCSDPVTSIAGISDMAT